MSKFDQPRPIAASKEYSGDWQAEGCARGEPAARSPRPHQADGDGAHGRSVPRPREEGAADFPRLAKRQRLLDTGYFLGPDLVQLVHASGDGGGTTVHVVGLLL